MREALFSKNESEPEVLLIMETDEFGHSQNFEMISNKNILCFNLQQGGKC